MMLIVTVTKARVSYCQTGLWNIIMHLELRDGSNLVIDKDYSAELSEGETIASKSPELIEAIQADIDQYKSEQLLFKKAALTTLATTIKAGLEI